MCTNRLMTKRWCQLALVVSALVLIFRVGVSAAVADPTLEQDLALDLDLNVLEAPMVQPLGIPGAERGLPLWPIYKQEPPGTQGDFSLPGITSTISPDPAGTGPGTTTEPGLGPAGPGTGPTLDPSPGGPPDTPIDEVPDGGPSDTPIDEIPVIL